MNTCHFHVFLRLSQRSIFSAVLRENDLTLMHYLPRIASCSFWFHFLGSGMSDTIILMISWSLQEAVIAELSCLIWYRFLLNRLGIW